MAKTGLVQNRRFEDHVTGPGHPERPQRVAHVAAVLADRGLTEACTPIEAVPVDMALVRLNHDEEYINRLQRACESGAAFIDVPDSPICGDSFDVARLAAGAVIQAVDAVSAGEVDNAFCAIRPPGHHAERSLSLGFCLLNSVAIAARHLLYDHDLSRVLILDWDVHHGNGTQHSFEDDPRVLFISLHGHPGVVYPGTGYAEERGHGEGEGFTLNIPVIPPGPDEVWRRAFDDQIDPAVDAFAPQFVLISAGFDAHRCDPLAPLELETESYGWMTDRLLEAAGKHSGGRLVSVLEGGYDLDALGDSVALHLERLLSA
jgi:acetoin utilization deacetylase AcuC-like enzyme